MRRGRVLIVHRKERAGVDPQEVHRKIRRVCGKMFGKLGRSEVSSDLRIALRTRIAAHAPFSDLAFSLGPSLFTLRYTRVFVGKKERDILDSQGTQVDSVSALFGVPHGHDNTILSTIFF